ncbi:hypothetical protein [Frankia sp. Cas3]|uniref:hypothetical protein n=1 Tax=Frankia sp. Cas3 TaxID=3073926 RepID=UPI002AD3EBA7|nr:hypothetical protein [Frankia sp. Cas3]
MPCPDAPSPDGNESAQTPGPQSSGSSGFPAADQPSGGGGGGAIFDDPDHTGPAGTCCFNCGSGIGGIRGFGFGFGFGCGSRW